MEKLTEKLSMPQRIIQIIQVFYEDWLAPEPSCIWAVALLVVLYVAIRHAWQGGLYPRVMYWAGMCGILGGLWGGHLFYVLAAPQELIESPFLVFRFIDGGKSIFGAFCGAGVFAWLYLRWQQAPFLAYADAALPAIALGYAVARLGCFLNGDDFGTPSDLPWTVQFPQGTAAFASHVAKGWIRDQDMRSLPVHPTQLYHAAAGLLLFLMLRRWWGKWPGSRLAMALASYGALRFILQLFRGDAAPVLGSLDRSQIVSFTFVLVAGLWWLQKGRTLTRPQEAVPLEGPGALLPWERV
jgi:phosphatidylglycerol---prolipoprotein diacylglyceryl transferase